jgi:ABC-type Na+ efflux pump permease subunit
VNWRSVRAIARKDLYEVRRNRMVWMPMVVLPVLFCLIMPLVLLLVTQAAGQESPDAMLDPDLAQLLENLPPPVKAELEGLSGNQQMIVIMLGFLFAPLFLILPVMTASTIGTNSFVGEKERKTIESLLYTPATDRELFVGKMLAAILPALVITWLSFVVYTLVLNVVGAPVMGRAWFPTPAWYPLILWVTPAVAGLGVLGAVLVSARASTFMEAYQTTGILVVPLLLLVFGQVFGLITLSVELALVVGLLVWLVDLALLWTSQRLFSRYRLFESGSL